MLGTYIIRQMPEPKFWARYRAVRQTARWLNRQLVYWQRHASPEAFEYGDDVTPEAIAQLRAEADEILSKGEWTTIEGYVGVNKQTPRVG